MNDLQFTLKDCDDVVKQCLQIDDVQTTDFEIIPRQKNNYIFVITIDRPNKQTLYLYAKSKSKSPRNAKIFDDFKTTLREFNTKITPKFVCGKSELLFFEDLTCQKFQTNPDSFDLKHVQRVLGVLAEFHASGFVYDKTGLKKLVEEYNLKSSNFDLNEVGDLIWALVDNKETVDDVRKTLEDIQKSKFVRTLCHGNLVWSNILYHYENGVPNECRLVNFGGRLHAPPAYDVLQAIFFNTSENFRQRNLEDLLFYYYNRLEEELKKYGLRIDEILPFEDFQLSSSDVLPLVKIEAVMVKKKIGDEDEIKRTTLELKEALSFSILTKEDCYVIVKKVINSSDYDLISFVRLSKHRLKIKIRHSLDDKTISCFVKSKPKQVRDACFRKELFIYSTFIPKLHQLGISLMNDCLPLCHYQKPEVLVLEDLQDFGCELEPKLVPLVVKKMAKFHACSLLIEEEMSKKMKSTYRLTEDYEDFLKDSFFGDKLHLVKESLDLFPDKIRGESLQRLLQRLAQIFAKPSPRFRNVVSIGVSSSKQIMVKFDDDTPVDCRFVDFQTTMYCPPSLDFLSLVYLTTIKKEEELMQIYYDELGKIVASYNYNVGKFFSYHEFVESVEYYRPQAIIQVLIYNITKEKKSSIDGDKNRRESLAQLCGNPVFRQKLQQNVCDLYEVCSMFSS